MRDQLDDDALEARKRGLHYGDYMAIKVAPVAVPPKPAKSGQKCEICGSPLVRRKQKKYCSDECRAAAQKKKPGTADATEKG